MIARHRINDIPRDVQTRLSLFPPCASMYKAPQLNIAKLSKKQPSSAFKCHFLYTPSTSILKIRVVPNMTKTAANSGTVVKVAAEVNKKTRRARRPNPIQ